MVYYSAGLGITSALNKSELCNTLNTIPQNRQPGPFEKYITITIYLVSNKKEPALRAEIFRQILSYMGNRQANMARGRSKVRG